MNLYEEIEKIKASGYSEQNAQSKLGQDIVLKAIADSGMARNATIKGGVVMRSISGNARRATQDLDLDFIRYSISDDSIRRFVENEYIASSPFVAVSVFFCFLNRMIRHSSLQKPCTILKFRMIKRLLLRVPLLIQRLLLMQ